MQKCGGIADNERKLVDDRITDAVGHDVKRKTWYLCEIKVNWPDFQKSLYQIYDTAFRFPRNPLYNKSDTIVPVIAFPSQLQKELEEYDNWDSLRDACRKLGIAIWVVEQSGVREEITSPKAKVVKTKSVVTKIVKTKRPKTKTTKTKTTGAKTVKSKPRATKSSKVKQTEVKKTVRKISKTTGTKSKAEKTKSRGRT